MIRFARASAPRTRLYITGSATGGLPALTRADLCLGTRAQRPGSFKSSPHLHDNSRFESASFTIRREEGHDFVQRNLTID